jgi:ABC-type lipoprotein release transport system permease subunit
VLSRETQRRPVRDPARLDASNRVIVALCLIAIALGVLAVTMVWSVT